MRIPPDRYPESWQPLPFEDSAILQKIRRTFAQSPVFCEARISNPIVDPEGKVILEVGFGNEPALFRVIATSLARAYTIIYEMAIAMIEAERSRRRDGPRGAQRA